jgi:putative ABC transport system permease protein
VARIGPGRFDDPAATTDAIVQTTLTAVAGLVLLGVVTAVTAHRESGEPAGAGRARELAARTPWDVILLLLSGVALLEARSSDPARQGVDLLVLVFPLLFLSGAAGLVSRGLGRLLPRIGAGATGGGPSRFLAIRRLGAAGRTALLLVAGASVAAGLLVYAATLSASARATSEASARVLVGAPTRAVLEPHAPVPPRLPAGTTAVRRAPGSVLPDRTTVDVLAVDPATFESAAAWDASFASEPLASMLERLDAEAGADELPAIAVGVDVPEGATFQVGPARAPAVVVGRADAFPGMPEGRPMVVVSRDALLSVVEEVGGNPDAVPGRTEVWSRDGEARLLETLAATRVERVDTVERAAETLRFVALRWALGLLLALGALTGLIALAGVLLYLQSRQKQHQVSYAIASRMGLSAGQHGRSVLLELGGLLGAAVVLGVVLAVLAGLLVKSELDLLPAVPPDAILRIPWAAIGATVAAAALAVVLGAVRARFAADRTNVAEVLRLAE